jgi:hypothetical protein
MKLGTIVLSITLFCLLFILSCSSPTGNDKVANPILTPPGGIYSQPQQVSISCATEGAEIRYTLDGSIPPTNSIVYTGPFEVPLGTTVKAIASKAGKKDSSIISAFYSGTVPTPVITPESGTYLAGTYIRIAIDGLTTASNWPEGTSVRYTTDGTEPDTTSLLYEFPFQLNASYTLKARVYRYNWTPGPVFSAVYSIYPEMEAIGSCDTPGLANDVAVNGSYAYLADGNSGLQIINIGNPAAPAIVGNWDSPDYSKSVGLYGNLALVADLYSGLRVIDISKPDYPVFLTLHSLDNSCTDLAVQGEYAYAVTVNSRLFLLELEPWISVYNNLTLPETALEIAVQGDYAYLACQTTGLVIVNISDPKNPVVAGICDTPGGASGVSVSGNYAYLADGSYGMQIINISNPAAPVIVGNLPTGTSAGNTAVQGNYVYLSVYNFGLLKVNVSNSTNPVIEKVYPGSGLPYRVAFSGAYIYLSDYSEGLKIIPLGD